MAQKTRPQLRPKAHRQITGCNSWPRERIQGPKSQRKTPPGPFWTSPLEQGAGHLK